MRTISRGLAGLFALSFSLAGFVTPAQAQTITTVMTGLDSPRGLAFGPEGGLYVAEAGEPVNSGNCVAVNVGMNCYSETGKVTRLYKGVQERVATGLPSLYNTIRRDVVGANDISFQGRGGAYVSIGWGGAPEAREALDAVRWSARSSRCNPAGTGASSPILQTLKTPPTRPADRRTPIRLAWSPRQATTM